MVSLRWGLSKACGLVAGVGVGVVCQGLGPLGGGDPDALVSRVLASPPEDEVHDGLAEAFPWDADFSEGPDGEGGSALLPAVPAQGGFQGPALGGCVKELGVADGGRREGGCSGSGNVWWGGLSRSSASASMCARSSVGMARLGGAEWSLGLEAAGSGVSQVLVVRGPCVDRSSGARWWFLGGLWMDMAGVCGLLSRLVDIWVMNGMVMDETHHLFPGCAFRGLLPVCQQEAFAMHHLGCCPADRFQLEVCCCLHRIFCVLG